MIRFPMMSNLIMSIFLQTLGSLTTRVGKLPPIAIKLDGTNHPLWLAQVVRHLKGRNFMGYVDGRGHVPPIF
ncbi:hypothetical protein ACE6H2_027952 [Prunus campanulata]